MVGVMFKVDRFSYLLVFSLVPRVARLLHLGMLD